MNDAGPPAKAPDPGGQAPPLDDRPVELEIRIPKIMRLGLTASLVVMCAGLLAVALFGGNAQTPLRLREVPAALLALDPRGLLAGGIFLLLLTPLARVAASVLHFAGENDRLYVALTLAVATNLALAAWIGAAL